MHACDAIIFDYDLVNKDEILIDFSIHDRYPSLPNLRCTAQSGCSLCALLIDSVTKVFINQSPTQPIEFEITGKLLTEGMWSSEPEEDEDGACTLSLKLAHSEGKDIPLHFSIYATEGTIPASVGRIRRRPLHEDVTSCSAIDLMNRWVHECQTDHDSCKLRKDPALLTRVLDLSTKDLGADCRLVQAHSIADKTAPYTALSHCWGPLGAGTPIATTTSTSLSQRQKAILLEGLPRNFKDVITITRLLGIRYLWIDSLCIIQDSREDWNREGRRMGQTYEGAYLTVAATGSSSANEGFLSRTPPIYANIPFRTSALVDEAGGVFIRPTNSPISSFEHDIHSSVWDNRAWTLQERYLSRRMLHFCKDKFYFECRSGSRSEHNEPEVIARFPVIFDDDVVSDVNVSSTTDDNGDQDDSNNVKNPISGSHPSEEPDSVERSIEEDDDILEVDYSFHLFYRLIGQYSTRKLTFAADKLPALAGIANKVHLQSGSTYLAGLWEDDLAYGLLWMAPDPDMTQTALTYRAPSWSWASLDGQITWPSYWCIPDCPDAGRPAKSAIWIIDAHVDVSGDNPYGEIKSAYLVLRAKSITVSVTGPTGRRYRGRKSSSSFQHDLLVTDPAGQPVIGWGMLDLLNYEIEIKETRLLQIHEQIHGVSSYESCWSGLILEMVRYEENASSVFKRIGIYQLTEDSLDVFNDIKDTELKIV